MFFKNSSKLIIGTLLTFFLSACGNEYHPEKISVKQLIEEAKKDAKIPNASFENNQIKIYFTNLHDNYSSLDNARAFNKKMKSYVPEYPRSLGGLTSTVQVELQTADKKLTIGEDIVELFDDSTYLESLRDTSPVGEEMAELLMDGAKSGLFVIKSSGGYINLSPDYKGQKAAVDEFSKRLDALGGKFKNQYAQQFLDEHVIGTQTLTLNDINQFDADYDSGVWLVEMHLSGKTRRGKQKSLTVGAIVNTAYLSENARAALMNSEVFEPSLDDKTIEAINGFIANKGEHFLTRSYF
jgi:hypothetical protein